MARGLLLWPGGCYAGHGRSRAELPLAAANDETIRGVMEDVRFFDTAQAGWVAAMAVKRFGGRYREAIRRGIRERSRPEVVVRGLGRLGLEEPVAEALECLLRGTI